MDLLNLQGKLTLDTSEYEAAIQRAVQLGNSTFAGGIQSVAGSTQQLQSAMTGAGTQAQAFGQQMQGATQQTSSFGAMVKNAVSVTLGNLFTKAITNASHALMGFAKQSISTGMSFDSAMSQVAATMGVTTDEVQELREYAEKMGATTAFSATQSAEALNYMALAGYDAEKSMKMLPNVLNLAASGGMQLARASDMVTDAQSALGLSTEQTTEMVNQMAMAASKSNTSVEQLGDAILQIGGTAKKLKGGTTELATILGILADNGMKGAEGGTHLRNMMNSLMSPTSKATKMMDELGISLYDADGNMRSLNDVFLDMRNAMEQMATQEERDKVVSTIFNARDMKAAEALLAGVGERYQELSGYIDQAAGSAQDMADTKLDNLQGDITLFKSAVEGAQIAISEKLTPSLRKFTQFGAKAVSEMSEGFREKGLKGAIEGAYTAINTAFDEKTANKIYAAKNAVVALTAAFAAFKGLSLAASIATTVSAAGSLSAAIGALNINPLIAAGTAAIAAAAAFKSYVDNINVVPIIHFTDAQQDAIDSVAELNKQMYESRKASEEKLKGTTDELNAYTIMAQKLFALNDVENKSITQKEQMKFYVEQLNGAIDGLNIEYDDQTGKIKANREEVEKLIQAYKNEARVAAAKDQLIEIYKNREQAEKNLEKATLARQSAQNALSKKRLELFAAEKEYNEIIGAKDLSFFLPENAARAHELSNTIETLKNDISDINNGMGDLDATWLRAKETVKSLDEQEGKLSNTLGENAVKQAENQMATSESIEKLTGVTVAMVNSMGAVGEAAVEMQNTIVAAEDGTITAYATLGARTLELNEQEITSIAEAIDAYDTLYEARREAIQKSVDLYKGFEADTSTTYTDLWNNLNESAFYLNDWTTAIEQLQAKADKGLMSQDFLDSLKDMGLDSWNIVYDMNHATSGQLQQYSQLWDETTANMEKTTERIMAKDTETIEAFLGSVSKISGADIQQYRDMFEKIGIDVTGGFAKGVEESIEKAREANEKLAEESIDTLTEEFEEHSPSKVTEKIGYFFDIGLANGIQKNMGPVANAARNLAIKAYNTMAEALKVDSPSKLTEKLGAFTGQGFALGMKGEEDDVLTASQLLAQSAVEPLEGLTPVVSTAGVKPVGDTAGARESSPTTIILQVDGRTLGQASFSTINELLGRQTIFDVGGYART